MKRYVMWMSFEATMEFDAKDEDDAIAQATEFVSRHSVVDADGNVSEDFIEQDPNIVEEHEIKKGERT